MNELCVKSILDQDLYKLTMMQFVLKKHPGALVSYVFNNRRPEKKFNQKFLDAFKDQLSGVGQLKANEQELEKLFKSCSFLDKSSLHPYLSNFRFNPDQIDVNVNDGELDLRILESTWESSISWEVPLLAMISELYFEYCDTNWKDDLGDQYSRLQEKARILRNCQFSDFGTRRRRNFKTQDLVVETLCSKIGFRGTSNVHLALKYGVSPIGTMAHELLMAVSVIKGMRHANKFALEEWSDVFQGNLGIALPDTFGTDAFFEDFDGYLARLFDGVRHDSGDPYAFGHKVINHYKKLRIDPMSKVIVFSDGLTAESGAELTTYFNDKIKVSLGIGTQLTNDYPDSKALNIVIKMATCNGVPVVKLSDVDTKAIGDRDALRVARWIFHKTPLDT